MNNLVKHYHSYHEMILDFAALSDGIDPNTTLSKAPVFSFYSKDGKIHLGGTFQIFLVKLVEATGIKINPTVSIEMPGVYAVSYADYAPVSAPEVEVEKIKIEPVDTPARRRSTRTKTA